MITINPLGGSSEIGSNMVTVDDGKNGFIIDCGILFPYENFFDINYLIPDFSHINKDLFNDIIFTHGHEDHIGAARHIFDFNPDINVHTSEFTKNLINHKTNQRFKYNKFNDFFEIGDFTIFPVPVTHSIPETHGLVITHKSYDLSITYISDFKVDSSPLFENPINFEQLIRLQNKKLNLALIDSTNITLKTKSASESQVKDTLDNYIKNAEGRLLITLFSSNVHRIKSIYESCKKHGKTLFTSGRSVKNYIQSAIDCGIIDQDKKIYEEDSQNIISSHSVILISGCQGDFFSSLRRYAAKEHSRIKIQDNDTVLFSSKAIPGNEKAVARIINDLIDNKVNVITSYIDPFVHSSGHPPMDEIKEFISKTNITDYIPIHGESFFLDLHEKFVSREFPHIKTYQVRNFSKIKINTDLDIKTERFEQLPPKIVLNDGTICERSIISERRKLATRGIINISCVLKSKKTRITILGVSIDDHFLKDLESIINLSLSSLKNTEQDSEKLRLAVLKFFKAKLNSKPIINVHLL